LEEMHALTHALAPMHFLPHAVMSASNFDLPADDHLLMSSAGGGGGNVSVDGNCFVLSLPRTGALDLSLARVLAPAVTCGKQ
jgi:hypothetical protein